MGIAKEKGATNEPAGGYRRMYVPGAPGAGGAAAAQSHHHHQHSGGGGGGGGGGGSGVPSVRAQLEAQQQQAARDGGKGRKPQPRPGGGFTQMDGDDGWGEDDGAPSAGRRSRGHSSVDGGPATAASLDRRGVTITWVCPICTFAGQ
jgi:hypothetical protein